MRLTGGIDLGPTKIEAVVLDGSGVVRGQSRRPTPDHGTAGDVAEAMAQTLREAAGHAGVESHLLLGVGLGCPGVVDSEAGTVRGGLPGWERPYRLGAEIGRLLDVPVSVHDAMGAALEAEARLGSGMRHRSFLYVSWAAEVETGLYLDGRRWTGRGAAGALGRRVEARAGRRAMERRAKRLVKEGSKTQLFRWQRKESRSSLTSGLWAKGLRKEDAVAVAVVERAEKALAVGVASAVNLLDVEAVVLGGGMANRLGKPLAGRLRDLMLPHLVRPERPPAVLPAALGDHSAAAGAALLAPGAASPAASVRK